jgi:hypothetical protein
VHVGLNSLPWGDRIFTGKMIAAWWYDGWLSIEWIIAIVIAVTAMGMILYFRFRKSPSLRFPVLCALIQRRMKKIVVSTVWAVLTFAATCVCIVVVNELKWEFIRKITTPPNVVMSNCGPRQMPGFTIPVALFNSGLCLWLGVRGRLLGTRRPPPPTSS